MGVSLNGGTPKWMVKIMENVFKMDGLGVPLFGNIHIGFFTRSDGLYFLAAFFRRIPFH